MRRLTIPLLAACLLLTGCAPLLDRTYSTVELHSSKFWESEAAGTLRAESYQDIVNDLLILIGQHRDTATLRLYNYDDDLAVTDALEAAAAEVQQETPMGAYAAKYITSTSQAQRGYYEISVQIGYRRTLEQMQAVVNATSTAALYDLLNAALDAGKTELTVRVSYWGEDEPSYVEEILTRLRVDRGLQPPGEEVLDAGAKNSDAPPAEPVSGEPPPPEELSPAPEETPGWTVSYYPSMESAGLVEFLLGPEPEPPEGASSQSPPGSPAENS